MWLRFRTLGCSEKHWNRWFLLYQANPSNEYLIFMPLDQGSKDFKVWLKSDCYTGIAGVFESSRKTVRVQGRSTNSAIFWSTVTLYLSRTSVPLPSHFSLCRYLRALKRIAEFPLRRSDETATLSDKWQRSWRWEWSSQLKQFADSSAHPFSHRYLRNT